MSRLANNAAPGSMFKVPLNRDKRHLAAIRWLTCCCCGRVPFENSLNEAAHVRRGHYTMARKPGDNQTVPLCHTCHMREHTGPVTFWDLLGRDPLRIAEKLYAVSPDVRAMQQALNGIL